MDWLCLIRYISYNFYISTMDLSILESKIKALPLDDQNVVYNQLLNLVTDLSIDISTIQTQQKSTESCTALIAKAVIQKKIGFQYGIQRYCCKECGRNYRDTTGTLMQECAKEKANI
jgi:hypothetical protein